jgi:hypothetical protein
MGGTKTKKTWHAIICAQQKSMDWTRIGRNRRWSDIDKNILQKTCGESGESETNLGGAPLCADHGGRPADLKGGESIDSAWWAEDVKLLNEAPSYSFRRAKRWLQIGDDDNNVAVDRFGFLPIAKVFLVQWVKSGYDFSIRKPFLYDLCSTRSEAICPRTSKLACWQVQLWTASKVGRRAAGSATASIEASLLAGDIIHPPAQMVLFMLADELCRPPA